MKWNIVLASLVGALMVVSTLVLAVIPRQKNLNDLYEVAKQLESAYMQVTENRQAYADKRTRLVYSFIRETKSAHCDRHHQQLQKTMDDYRVKAYNYVADLKKPTNWFSGFKKFVGPIGSMRDMGKTDKYLGSITQRYESQSSSGLLSDTDVDCDLSKLLMVNLEKMMFVLQTDVKYLITEDPHVNNIAIYRQLVENKFIENTNFYDVDTLTRAQKQLLFQFYSARVDQERVTVAEAVEHYYEPGNLILGRLLDSCHKLLEYRDIWLELEPSRSKVCSQSKSDLANKSFADEHKLSQFNNSIDFCDRFLDSL